MQTHDETQDINKWMKTGKAGREGEEESCASVQSKKGNIDGHSGTAEGSESGIERMWVKKKTAEQIDLR